MTFSRSKPLLILFSALYFNKVQGDTNNNSPLHSKLVSIEPYQTKLVHAVLNKDLGEFTLDSQLLPEVDIRAFASDTIHNTFVFSGGDPNKLIRYNKHSHKLHVVADDVIQVTSMDTDPRNHLLYLIDSGKHTMEVMNLRSYKRQVIQENVTDNDIGLILDPSVKLPAFASPFVQKDKVRGKVFTLFEKFQGENPQSVLLGHNVETESLVFASWDGNQVADEIKKGTSGNLNGLEIKGDYLKDIIYVSNQNGNAIVAI